MMKKTTHDTTDDAAPESETFVSLGTVEALTGHDPNGREDDGGTLDGYKLKMGT
jgi:hypothetical protein